MYTTYADYGGRVKLTWVPSGAIPPVELVTSVHGFCFWRGDVLLVELDRGYDIPGGRREEGETPDQTMRREALEEGCVRVGRSTLLGYVEVDHSENPSWQPGGRYPKVGCQLFYRVEVEEVLPFTMDFESRRRIFVPPIRVEELYHGWSGLGQHIFAAAQEKFPEP